MPGNETFSKNFFLAAMFVLMIISIIIIKPLFIALLSAAVLAYLCYPIYKRLAQKINKRIAAGLIIIFLVLILAVPMYFVVNALAKEGYTLFITAKQKLSPDALALSDCEENPYTFCEINNKIITSLKDPQTRFYLEDAISKFSTYIIDTTSRLLVNLPILLIDILVMFFAIYYLLIDGAEFINRIKGSIPLKKHHVDHIIQEFNNFTFATLYGNFITAGIQGTIGGVTFALLGLATPILAGLAMAFFAFIPFIGTPIIWIPAAIGLFIAGETVKGIILLLVGLFIISTIDNILKPMIIGKRTKLHPAAVLVGIIGGIFIMGPIGIIGGPLVFSLLISFIEVYYKEGLGFNHS
jgi:predicted PurR-regulated permease PerM